MITLLSLENTPLPIDIINKVVNKTFKITGDTITISKDTEYMFNPNYIMDGFKEFVNENVDYAIKRTKILY